MSGTHKGGGYNYTGWGRTADDDTYEEGELVTELEGFDELSKLFEEYSKKAEPENVSRAVKAGADAFVKDVRALPRPRSKIGGVHTHMLDTVTTARDGQDWLVGWGSFYGRMVENGHRKPSKHHSEARITGSGAHRRVKIVTVNESVGRVAAQPHLRPTWEQNKEKYMEIMTNTLFGD